MGFYPFRVEPAIWTREKNSLYQYIAVYVDDLDIVDKTPKETTDVLTTKHKFKHNGTGLINYHLGYDFFRDKYGTLCFSPRKYIEKMIEGYITMFVRTL